MKFNHYKFISSYLFIFFLVSCNKEINPPFNEEDPYIHVHASTIDGSPSRINDIEVFLGEDISSKIDFKTKGNVWDGHPEFIYRIYKDVSKTELLEASKLKTFDGSFSNLYTLCSSGYTYLVNDNYFDNSYQNLHGDSVHISNGVITGSYGEYAFTTGRMKSEQPYHITVDNIFLYHNGEKIDFDVGTVEISFVTCDVKDNNGGIQTITDITKISIWAYIFFEDYFTLNNIEYDFKDMIYVANNTKCLSFD